MPWIEGEITTEMPVRYVYGYQLIKTRYSGEVHGFDTTLFVFITG